MPNSSFNDDGKTEPLRGLTRDAWIEAFRTTTEAEGQYSRLGPKHFASFLAAAESDTLLVTFETVDEIRQTSPACEPMGWDMVRALDWAHLGLISDGQTWFRDSDVWDFFDQRTDEGLFDSFERVVFYGVGACGYAAAAFCVSAPGASVVLVQPHATQDPRIAGWDTRFRHARARDFQSRYGYAPAMVESARGVFILFDPVEAFDAMHAALYTRPNVTLLPMRHMGKRVAVELSEMDVLYPLLVQAGMGTLSCESFAELYRARRTHLPYLRRLSAALTAAKRPDLSLKLARNVVRRLRAPEFNRQLREMSARAPDESQGTTPPSA